MLKYILMHLKSELEYRASFILTSIAQVLGFFTYYFVMYSLFNRFQLVKDFTFYEIVFGFSIVQIGYSITEVFARGFDKFSTLIKNGNFDLLLVRPENIFIQIFGSKIEVARIGKIIYGIIIFIIASIKLNIVFNIQTIFMIAGMIIGCTAIFTSIFILGASLCFITIEGLEVANVFTYGTRDFAQYPIGIYNKFVKMFFTYIIPIGLVNYYPLMVLLGKQVPTYYMYLPYVAILTLVPAVLIFNMGVSKYKSTGS